MARYSSLVKPEVQELLHLTVVRTERLSEHWMRVTLGGGDIAQFTPMGFDQWFRLFLPLGGDEGLDRLPAKANKLFGYLKYLRIPDGMRPVMRNYTVRAYRADGASGGPEIDVDFVLHGSGETAGPASRWAQSAEPGESVVIIDEGLGFNPERGVERVVLVADETGAPAVAGVCASLPSRDRRRHHRGAVAGRRARLRCSGGDRRAMAGTRGRSQAGVGGTRGPAGAVTAARAAARLHRG